MVYTWPGLVLVGQMNPQEKKDMYRLSFASMTWIRFQGSKQ